MRADVFLVEHGYAASRAEAQTAIAARTVTADGKTVVKPTQALDDKMQIAYAPAHPYVSRGALKLIAALDHFSLSPDGMVCLDVGASTGGFTQVLLERGAKKVYAIDVGHGQLHAKIRDDSRVVSFEGLNARELSPKQITGKPRAIVADVSFISLKLALPSVLEMTAKGGWLVALVKPQFEVGKENIGKGGIVKNDYVRTQSLVEIVFWLSREMGWNVLVTSTAPSPAATVIANFLLQR